MQDAGLQDQIALVGFGDFPLADLPAPGVSVIAQDAALLGREATRLLFTRLDGYDHPGQDMDLRAPDDACNVTRSRFGQSSSLRP